MAALIVMAYALAELRHGVVARQHENGFKCGHNFAHTLYLVVCILTSEMERAEATQTLFLFSYRYTKVTEELSVPESATSDHSSLLSIAASLTHL